MGKSFSPDPEEIKYPWQSPYAYHRNNPIAIVDYMGLGDPPGTTWDATKDKGDVPNNSPIPANIKKDASDWNQGAPACPSDCVMQDYNDVINTVEKGRTYGFNTAANNLQFFLNGSGGTKIEDINFLQKYGVFNSADKRLNNYVINAALKEANNLKPGDSKIINGSNNYQFAASVEPLLYFAPTDLNLASGTSFIKCNPVITITKATDNSITISATIHKTWFDTYDWHPGAGVYFGLPTDDQMDILTQFGAKDFEMRAYYSL